MRWLFFTNLDLDGVRPDVFPAGPHLAQGLGGQLVSQLRSLVDSSLQHTNKLCNSGNSAFQDVFSHMSKFAGALFLWPNSILFRRLSGNSHGAEPMICQTSTHITSSGHLLEKLILDSALNNEVSAPLLFAKFAGSTIRRLWKGVEHQAFPVLSLAVAIIPPFDNLSSKVLSDSIPLKSADEQTKAHMHQVQMENDYRGCSSRALSNMTWARDAVEPKTGIKFPAILDMPLDGEVKSSNLTCEVLVGTGFRSMRIIKFKSLKLYAFGLYVHPDSICEKLAPKYASIPISDLTNHTDFFQDLLREDIQMTVRLVVNCNGLKISTVRNAFEKALRNRLQKLNPYTDYDCLRAFGSHFTQDIPLPVGTSIDFRQTADGQLVTEIEGKHVGAVQSKDLCKAFFDMYIGDLPVSVQAKQEFGQNVAGLIKKC